MKKIICFTTLILGVIALCVGINVYSLTQKGTQEAFFNESAETVYSSYNLDYLEIQEYLDNKDSFNENLGKLRKLGFNTIRLTNIDSSVNDEVEYLVDNGFYVTLAHESFENIAVTPYKNMVIYELLADGSKNDYEEKVLTFASNLNKNVGTMPKMAIVNNIRALDLSFLTEDDYVIIDNIKTVLDSISENLTINLLIDDACKPIIEKVFSDLSLEEFVALDDASALKLMKYALKDLSITITIEINPLEKEEHNLYFYRPLNWENVYAYYFNDNDEEKAPWPGEKMMALDTHLYQTVVPEGYNHVVFSDGVNKQTIDLDVVDYNGYFTLDGTLSMDKYNGDFYEEPLTKTIYVKYGTSATDAYLYQFSSELVECAPWPGEKMMYIGNGVYKLEVNPLFDNLVFKDINGNQTVDFTILLSKDYYVITYDDYNGLLAGYWTNYEAN